MSMLLSGVRYNDRAAEARRIRFTNLIRKVCDSDELEWIEPHSTTSGVLGSYRSKNTSNMYNVSLNRDDSFTLEVYVENGGDRRNRQVIKSLGVGGIKSTI